MLESSEGRKKNLEEDIEKGKAALEQAEAELERAKSELQPQIDDLRAKIGAIDSIIAEIMKERDQVSPNVSAHTQRTYDAIRKKSKSGRAIALVGGSKTCSVCHIILRPHLYSEVRRGSKIILCESCGSMLIIDESAIPPTP
jgi:predicted  nucleic acid-binding Zn-ribbon protein